MTIQLCGADVPALLAGGEHALTEDGDLRASRACFDQAYTEAERACDATGMAVAALGLCGLWVHEHRDGASAAVVQARLRRALSLVEPDSVLAVRLRARLVGEADYRAGTHTAALAALDQARATGDPVALTEALSIAHHCVLGPEHASLRQELAGELIAESYRSGRRSDLLTGLTWRAVGLFATADRRAQRSLTELRGLLAERDHLAVGFVVSAIEVMLAIRSGQLDRAERLAGACGARGVAAGDIDAAGWQLGQLITIRWYQGRLGELLPVLAELVKSATLSAVDHSSLAALAVAAAVAGDRRLAASSLAALRGRDLADLPRSSSWLAALNGAVQAAYLLSDAETAGQAYQLLREHADVPMVAGLCVACFGSTHHALGVAALTWGNVDLAVSHLRTAVQRNLALGHWPAVVDSRLKLAEALIRRSQPGDAAAARLERAEASADGAALGLAARGLAGRMPGMTVACAREGRYWRMSLGHRSTSVKHSVGMAHLAVLIANPGQEIPAVDLAAGLSALAGQAMSDQPVLDARAAREYRHRLDRVRAEIEELEAAGRADRAAPRRAERDWLAAELGRSAGLGGQARRFTGDAERARIAVGKAIRRAVDHIVTEDSLIGEHLRSSVHTGLRCQYRPL